MDTVKACRASHFHRRDFLLFFVFVFLVFAFPFLVLRPPTVMVGLPTVGPPTFGGEFSYMLIGSGSKVGEFPYGRVGSFPNGLPGGAAVPEAACCPFTAGKNDDQLIVFAVGSSAFPGVIVFSQLVVLTSYRPSTFFSLRFSFFTAALRPASVRTFPLERSSGEKLLFRLPTSDISSLLVRLCILLYPYVFSQFMIPQCRRARAAFARISLLNALSMLRY